MELLMPSGLLIVWAIITLVFFGVFVYAIIHCLRHQFETPATKLTWLIAIIFVPVLGPLLYVFIGRTKVVGVA